MGGGRNKKSHSTLYTPLNFGNRTGLILFMASLSNYALILLSDETLIVINGILTAKTANMLPFFFPSYDAKSFLTLHHSSLTRH